VGGFALNIRLLQGLHQQGQVLEQLAGVDVLLYGTDRPATDVFQAQGLFKPAVVGFNAPAPVIQVGKELGGERLGVQERRGQHLGFPGGQSHPDQPDLEGRVRINTGLLTDLSGPVPARHGDGVVVFSRIHKRADFSGMGQCQAHQELLFTAL